MAEQVENVEQERDRYRQLYLDAFERCRRGCPLAFGRFVHPSVAVRLRKRIDVSGPSAVFSHTPFYGLTKYMFLLGKYDLSIPFE